MIVVSVIWFRQFLSKHRLKTDIVKWSTLSRNSLASSSPAQFSSFLFCFFTPLLLPRKLPEMFSLSRSLHKETLIPIHHSPCQELLLVHVLSTRLLGFSALAPSCSFRMFCSDICCTLIGCTSRFFCSSSRSKSSSDCSLT